MVEGQPPLANCQNEWIHKVGQFQDMIFVQAWYLSLWWALQVVSLAQVGQIRCISGLYGHVEGGHEEPGQH